MDDQSDAHPTPKEVMRTVVSVLDTVEKNVWLALAGTHSLYLPRIEGRIVTEE